MTVTDYNDHRGGSIGDEPSLGKLTSKYRSNVLVSGSWGASASIATFSCILALVLAANNEWGPALTVGLLGVPFPSWLTFRSIRRELRTWRLLFYERGFVLLIAGEPMATRYSDVTDVRQELKRYGIGAWHSEALLFVETVSGAHMVIGREVWRHRDAEAQLMAIVASTRQ